MPVNSSKQSPCWKLKFDEQYRICRRTKALIGYKLTAPISSVVSSRDQHILLGTLEVFETDLNADQNFLVFDSINSGSHWKNSFRFLLIKNERRRSRNLSHWLRRPLFRCLTSRCIFSLHQMSDLVMKPWW